VAETPARGGRDGSRSRGRGARLETSAGGIVFRRDGDVVRYLLIRDPYLNWGLPKGHVERGETPLEAALREVMEETALDNMENVGELPTIDWFFRDKGKLIHKYCHFFLLESRAGEPKPQLDEGITECVWLPLEDALHRLTYDNAREVLRAAAKELADA
jgi:8-oxo-dGTP pyrophosphatase MutT (NUDIX family)